MFGKKKNIASISIKFRGTQGEEMYYVVESEKAAKIITDWFPKNTKVHKTDGFGQPGDFMIFVNSVLVHTKMGLSHGFLSTCAQEQKNAVKKAVQDVIDGEQPQGVEQQVGEALMKADQEKEQKRNDEIAAQKKAQQDNEEAELKKAEELKAAEERSKAEAEAEKKKKAEAEAAKKQQQANKRKTVIAQQKKKEEEEAEKQRQEEEEARKKEAEEEEKKRKEEEEATRLAEEAARREEEERKAKEEAEAIRRKKEEEEAAAKALELEAISAANKQKLLDEAAKRQAEQNGRILSCCRPVGGDDVDGELHPAYVS